MTKKNGKRLFTMFLLLVLTMSILTSRALAAGEKTIPVTISTGVSAGSNPQVDILWNDAWFTQSPTVYNHDLAIAAMALSGAAYLSGQNTGVKAALKALGFDHIESFNYHPSFQQASTVTAYTFALKKLSDGTYLAVVIIRGTGEYAEWAGNLNMGEGRDHQGFAQACNELLTRLDQYLTAAGITAEQRQMMKFLVAGHSRGAAVANLIAARLTEDGKNTKAAIYAYTFASPTVSFDAKEEGYSNIFNIVNDEDLVTQVPLPAWGCGRYGIDLHLPTQTRDGDAYPAEFDRMDETYTALTGKPYTAYQNKDTVRTLTNSMLKLVPSASSSTMAMLSALFTGNFTGLSDLIRENSLTALLLGRRMITLSNELTPLIQQESGGLASAHCMASYYSWLASAKTPEQIQALYGFQ